MLHIKESRQNQPSVPLAPTPNKQPGGAHRTPFSTEPVSTGDLPRPNSTMFLREGCPGKVCSCSDMVSYSGYLSLTDKLSSLKVLSHPTHENTEFTAVAERVLLQSKQTKTKWVTSQFSLFNTVGNSFTCHILYRQKLFG